MLALSASIRFRAGGRINSEKNASEGIFCCVSDIIEMSYGSAGALLAKLFQGLCYNSKIGPDIVGLFARDLA